MSTPYAATDAMLGCMANQYGPGILAALDVPDGCGVYRMQHVASGLFYVGGSTDVRRRVSEHLREMRRGVHGERLCALFIEGGAEGWKVAMLEVCTKAQLKAREQYFIDVLQPPLNISPVSHAPMPKGTKLDAAGCAERSRRTTVLWADPQYRERAVAARAGKAYNKGYKCTPAQIENRRKAARISMMKRWHPANWQAAYVRRYPEHAGDVT